METLRSKRVIKVLLTIISTSISAVLIWLFTSHVEGMGQIKSNTSAITDLKYDIRDIHKIHYPKYRTIQKIKPVKGKK